MHACQDGYIGKLRATQNAHLMLIASVADAQFYYPLCLQVVCGCAGVFDKEAVGPLGAHDLAGCSAAQACAPTRGLVAGVPEGHASGSSSSALSCVLTSA